MVQIVTRSFLYAVSTTLLVVLLLDVGSAQVMESNNYKMQSDSLNAGGGLSNSESFKMEDTVGEIATGNSTSTSFNLRAGYQQMQEVFLGLSAIPDAILSPNLGGVTGGTSTGSTTFVVTTDSPSGYTATIEGSNSPAMRSGSNSIADYVPVGGVPDFALITDSNEAHLAYSPEGTDIAVRFQDAGSVCGVAGSDTPNRCYQGLSTTPVEIVRRTTPNHPAGSTTTIKFSVGIGGTIDVPEGVYVATTTITALPL
ncbi:hypothetical protein K2P47_04440 [Patescibacteria group bacterium]|nr:hypothetical protein [Patescibacteria group bacterium]